MVSIPVALYPAVQENDVHFHQIHRKCGSRIRQQKWCPVDEEVVPPDEIARGWEISKGRYVLVEDEDLEALPVPALHTIVVSAFVDAKEIDPIYFDQVYYLEPEETGKKPYALLHKALLSKGVSAVAKIAIRSKESLTLLRGTPERILLETLYYPEEIREMSHAKEVAVEEKELKLAESLVDMLTEKFDPEQYHDDYRAALLAMIEAKSQGEAVKEQPEAPQAQVIDLFEALRRSVENAKAGSRSKEKAAS